MDTQKLTFKEYFQMLNIIYFAMLAGLVFFAIIAVYLNIAGIISPAGQEFWKIFIITAPLIGLVGILGSHMVFKNKLNSAKNKASLTEKITDYLTACVVRWALLEFPALFSIIVYLLTGDILFIGIAALIIAFFGSTKPNVEKTTNDLELDLNSQMIINDMDSLITKITINK